MALTFKTHLIPGSTNQAYSLGSETQTWKIYGLLNGTATYATTAERAGTAGYAITAGTATYAITAGVAETANYAITAGYATSALNAAHAQTAHYASSATYTTEAGHTTQSITIGPKSFNGGTAVTIEIGDLGLSKAIDFLGVTISNVTDDSDINPVTLVSGTAVSATSGNVVLVKGTGEEYLWSEDKWQSLGLATSYALANHVHGNLNNNGTLTAFTSSMNGAVLVVADPNVSNGIALSEVSFGSDTAKFLRNDGTWVTPSGTYSLPTASSTTLGGIKVGTGLSISSGTLSVNFASQINDTTNVAATPALVNEVLTIANGKGTVSSVAAGAGLTTTANGEADGGTITTTGTLYLTACTTATSAGPTAAATGTNGTTVAIPRIEVDKYGRVTSLSSFNYTSVDTTDNDAVTQSATTTSSWRKILLHYKSDSTSTAAVTTATNQVYAAVGIAAQPQTGKIRANAYNIADKVTLQYNTDTDALDFIFTI